MKIETSVISKEFTDTCNTLTLIDCAQSMIKNGLKERSVKLSFNLNDPDIYEFEYSKDDEMLSIVRKGTSLTDDEQIIGATGLVQTDTLDGLVTAAERILGITRVELTTTDPFGNKRTITVSEGWHMIQDEDEDIFMKAFADVNASLVTTDDADLQHLLNVLRELQHTIRTCKTAHPAFKLTAFLRGDLDGIQLAFDGRDYGVCNDIRDAMHIVFAMTEGYTRAKEEALKPENIGQIIDVFDDFLESKEIVIESSVNEMVESGEYSKNEAENGIMGCRTCIYGSDYDIIAQTLRKFVGI